LDSKNYQPEFDFKFHTDRIEKLEFEKKQRSNSGLFRVVLTKKSCFSMRKYQNDYFKWSANNNGFIP